LEMKIRELLQVEVWSKRTSWKIVVIGAIVLGVAWVGIDVWYTVQRNWLTSRERSAASVALASIDELHASKGLSDALFKEKQHRAKAQIDVATQAARTLRDQEISMELKMYFLDTVSTQVETRNLTVPSSPSADSSRKMIEKMKLVLPDGAALSASLHTTLKQ
jgi:hypothetical protein